MDDLLSLNTSSAANEGRTLHLKHPTTQVPLYFGKGDDKEPITIDLLGQDSDIFIKEERRARGRTIESMTKQVKYSPEAADQQADSTLARCTLRWNKIPQGWLDNSDSAEPADFTPANVLKLYGNPGMKWLRTQVDEFIGARANFLQGSPTN